MGDGALQPELAERLGVIEAWMQKHGESITGTTAGLEPWQCYAPSTRRDDTVYVHLLMRPYDTVTVRGVRTRRIKSVRALASGAPLQFETRCSIVDQLINPDPVGELTITVPPSEIDDYATVLAIEFAPEAIRDTV